MGNYLGCEVSYDQNYYSLVYVFLFELLLSSLLMDGSPKIHKKNHKFICFSIFYSVNCQFSDNYQLTDLKCQ